MSEKRLIEGETISRRRFFLSAWAVSAPAVMDEGVGMFLNFISGQATSDRVADS